MTYLTAVLLYLIAVATVGGWFLRRERAGRPHQRSARSSHT